MAIYADRALSSVLISQSSVNVAEGFGFFLNLFVLLKASFIPSAPTSSHLRRTLLPWRRPCISGPRQGSPKQLPGLRMGRSIPSLSHSPQTHLRPQSRSHCRGPVQD